MRSSNSVLLYAHSASGTLAQSCAGGFLGAFLLEMGFGIPATLALGAASFALRFIMRALALPVVRRLGYRRAFAVGTIVMALQYPMLPWVGHTGVLLAWLVMSTIGEALYWPILHAAMACAGTEERRGRQMGILSAVVSCASVGGPLLGGFLLQDVGPMSDFALAAVLTLLSALPLAWLGDIPAGSVPTLRQSLRDLDRLSVLAFAADGWMFAGGNYGWSLILFVALGSDYGRFGLANAAAGLLGALAGMACGHGIDSNRHGRFIVLSATLMGGATIWRSLAVWLPSTAVMANLAGSVVIMFYMPILMGMLYDRAKRSGQAYRFHFSTEGGFDIGGCLGCLASAAVAALLPHEVSLLCMPALLGLALALGCIRHGLRTRVTT